MLSSTFLSLSLFFLTSIATPAKRYDLDGNGVPDLCTTNSDGTASCLLSDGSLTTFKTSTTIPAPRATVTLPDPATFKKDNGTKWSIKYVGNLAFTGTLQAKGLGGDKCRSSKLGNKVIWSCGDMECKGGFTSSGCGFSMGPAFYGTSSVLTVNTTGISLVQSNDFAVPFSGDPKPVAPQSAFGMDTSNVAAINATHGVAYAFEIWRGASDGSFVNRGNAVVSVTLGNERPIATRVGPLLTGPNTIQLGLLAILRDGDFVYTYSIGGPSGIIVGRVAASDQVFSASAYSFLVAGSTSTWKTPGSIPAASSTTFGMTTTNSGGKFSCGAYGSVFFNTYLGKYVIICTAFENFTNMYVSATPFGPWSAEYGLLNGWGIGYGSMAHPEFSTDGGKTFHFSQGPDGPFNMFEVSFNF
ncbi:hypothetical protein B0H16DRAFT_1540129 [Mycena metata]|uniref:Uncharacterized protein n=1 Tax=Mycena metata TaxID=1033252 RepID=A0AAD7J670_9AGAR|nr:hypothetical protein B0H16DRAFT_1540129 [Mycena metata]